MSGTNDNQIQGQQQSAGPWNTWASGPSTVARISDLESGATYEVQVRKTFHGRQPSPWSPTVRMQTD